MLIRKNELHEPEKTWVTEANGWRCYKTCVVCGLKMFGEMDYNYCPRCGARFKEVENGVD